MGKYSSSIKTLLKKEEDREKGNIYFLSVYFPTKDYLKKEIKVGLKSLILQAFRSHRNLKNKNWLHHKIADRISRKIGLLRGKGKGFAIFVKFKAEKPKKKRGKLSELTLFFLHRKPKKEVYIGKIFDLDQLIWLDNVKIEACIFNLRRRKCEIYIVDNGEFKYFSTEKNKFIKEREQEYIEKQRGTSVRHGTGTKKLERKKVEENKRFLTYLRQIIKNELALRTEIKYFLIFYSVSFEKIIKKFVKNFPKTHTILVNKSMADEKKLKRVSLKKLKAKQEKIKEKLIQKAKSLPKKYYVEGWKKVTTASRKRKIDILFLDPTIRKKGYLYRKGFIYTYPVKNSRLVRNIIPWLVRNTIRSKGKIVFFQDKKKPIAAKLKYKRR